MDLVNEAAKPTTPTIATKSPKSATSAIPTTRTVTLRREEIYACGCTTTRIETIQLRNLDIKQCSGHGANLIKLIETTEYEQTEP
jgi:hypothetical protein